MKLYWVTTEDHDEDWFIVANSAKVASKFHEDSEGYNPGEAFAEKILVIPDDIPSKFGWPSDGLLLSIGARFISNQITRVVEIGDRKFCEGLMEESIREKDDDLFEKKGYGRLNDTKKPCQINSFQ
jgi:hypothetical protein